jgi:hypothetical protein
MVQLRYRIDQRDQLRRHCEESGVTGYAEGVTLQGAWVSASRHSFMLFDADHEDRIRKVCSELSSFGDVSHMPVISIDQIM